MYLNTLNKSISNLKTRNFKIYFKKTKDNIFSYSCVKEVRMVEAPQQNEVDLSCHSSLLGSVVCVEKSSSICCAEGLMTGLILIALFPPSAQSARCTKLFVCSRIRNGNSVSLSVFRESAEQISKCKIKYNFYKNHFQVSVWSLLHDPFRNRGVRYLVQLVESLLWMDFFVAAILFAENK